MLAFPTAAHTTVLLAAPPLVSILTLSSRCIMDCEDYKYCKHACTPERHKVIHSMREMLLVLTF